MDCIKRTRQRYREWRRPLALKASILSSIPLEILLEIVDHLPPSSAAVFSVSCIQIKRLLGTRYLIYLGDQPSYKLGFLQLLARDLPDRVACSICHKLHSTKNSEDSLRKVSQQGGFLSCIEADFRADVPSYIDRNFSSFLFQMAMKRYETNADPSRFLKLLSSETETR